MNGSPKPVATISLSLRFLFLVHPLGVLFALFALFAIGGPIAAQQPDTSLPAEVMEGIRKNIHSDFCASFEFERWGEERDETTDSMTTHAISRGRIFRDGKVFQFRYKSLSVGSEKTHLRFHVVDSFTTTLDSHFGGLDARSQRDLESGQIALTSEVWDLPEFANGYQFPGEVKYSFDGDPDIDSHMPFWSGKLNGIGNVRDIIENAANIQHVRSEYEGMESRVIYCDHEGRKCRFTFCPELDWMNVGIEVTMKGQGDQPNSCFEATVRDISEDGTKFRLVRENSTEVANRKTLTYRTVTRYWDVNRGSAAEAGWDAHLVPENSPVAYLDNSQIKLVWRSGRLEKSVDDKAIRNMDFAPLSPASGSANGPYDPVWLTFLFVMIAVPILYVLCRQKSLAAGTIAQGPE
jgi:hypothetical protein